jgi:hypothetical protein
MRPRRNPVITRVLDSLLSKAEAKACPSPWYTYGACINGVQHVTEHYYLNSSGLCLGPYTYTYSDFCN